MAEDFNTDSMLDMYLFENRQLLENLDGIVLEKQNADAFDEDDVNSISVSCIQLKVLQES